MSVFRLFLISALLLVLIFLQLTTQYHHPIPATQDNSALIINEADVVHVFVHPECPHCHHAKAFLDTQIFDHLTISYHDVSTPSGQQEISRVANSLNIDPHLLGVPLFIKGSQYRIGFDSPETTGDDLRRWLDSPSYANAAANASVVEVPVLGNINLSNTSLIMLTFLIALADGLNPCAMWVLLYLISLTTGISDKKHVYWLMGVFLISSGLLYYLFMAAWLNAFVFVGYQQIITHIIALSALGFGLDQLYSMHHNRGELVCEVSSAHSGIMLKRLRATATAPLSLISIVAMIALAFTVNSIEFVCSSALPAIYTHALSLHNLSSMTYYLYLLMYVVVFMLDDALIFGFALFAVHKTLGSRYALFARLMSSVLLIGLGVWMLLR